MLRCLIKDYMRTKPKFKIGQVVMRDDGPMKIENMSFHLKGQTGREEWLYGGDAKEAWESILRPLTTRECGKRN